MGVSRMTPSYDIDTIADVEDSDELEESGDPSFAEDEVEYSIVKGRWYRKKNRA